MPADASGVQANLHRSDEHSWALITRAPDSGPRPTSSTTGAIASGARAHAPPSAALRRSPDDRDLRPSIDIINGDLPTERGVFRSFLAGLHDVHVFTEYEGEQTGFQVNFTLLGAYRFLNITIPTSPIAASISAICWAMRRSTGLRFAA